MLIIRNLNVMSSQSWTYTVSELIHIASTRFIVSKLFSLFVNSLLIHLLHHIMIRLQCMFH